MAKAEEKMLTLRGALRVIELNGLNVDKTYQRGIVPKHKRIIAEFNKEALGIPLIAQRDDASLWIVDGLQRITALKALGHKTIRAEIFRSNGPEHEAEVFRIVNQNRTKLKAEELFRAQLAAGDEMAWELKRAVESIGWKIARGHKNADTPSNTQSLTFSSIGAGMKILAEKGGGVPAIKFILQVIKESWPDDPNGPKVQIVGGLYSFYRKLNGEVDLERLIPRLRRTTPAKLIYTAGLGMGNQASNVGDIIERVYRKRNPGLNPMKERKMAKNKAEGSSKDDKQL